jgi:TolA-binding protein
MILIRPLTIEEPPVPPAFLGASEPEPPALEPYQAPALPAPPPVPAAPVSAFAPVQSAPPSSAAQRTLQTFAGQSIEIPFQGNGWVYLGEADSRGGLGYESRHTEADGQRMVFRAESAGIYTLRFYKQDFIQDRIINEQVRVIVNEASERSAASWTTSQGPARAVEQAEATPALGTPPTSGEGAPLLPALAGGVLPDSFDYMQQAREAYTAGRFSAALAALDMFRDRYPTGSDEAWLLYGQVFEAAGDIRDIRSSLDYYRRLLSEYPQSPLCAYARKRIAYIERYFFMIP